MATLDQTLKLLITADGKGLSSALGKATAEIGGFAAKTKSALSGISGVFASLGATISAGAFAVGIKRTIDSLEEIGAAAKKSGVAVETLSALKYAAEQSETSFESLQNGLKFFNKTLGEAQRGSKAAADELRRFGVDAGADTREALLQIADVFSRLPDGAQKAEAAIKVFGRAGTDLIPLLNQGRAGINGLMQEAERLGLVFGGDVTKAADEFNDTLGAIKGAVSGFGVALTSQMLGPLQSVASAMKEAAIEGKGFWDTLNKFGANLGKQIFNAQNGPEAIARQIEAVADKMGRLKEELNWAAEQDPEGARQRIAEIQQLERELDNLTNTYNRLVREQQAVAAESENAKPLAIRTITDEQLSELKQQSNEYKKLITDIRNIGKDLTEGPQVDPKTATVLDIRSLQAKADAAIARGEYDKGQQYIANALKIIEALSVSGAASKSYLQDRLAELSKLAKVGQELIDLEINMPFVEDPQNSAAKVASAGIQSAQAEADANPIVLSYANADISNPDTITRLEPVAGLASGGPIRGAGTGTSDSIIARLSAGEYVLRAAAVKNYGLSFLEKLNAMRVPRFAAGGLVPTVPRFSSGGPVGVPVNIYLPDGQSFPMTAQPSVAKTLGRILSHEVLKRGRR